MATILIPVIICVVLLSFAIIVYVYVRVQRTQLRAIGDPTLPADPNNDEIGSTSHIDVSNVRSSFTNGNREHHSTNAGASGVSKMEDMQSNVDNVSHLSDKTTSDCFDIGSLQHEDTEETHKEESISLNETHFTNIDVSGLVTIIHSTYKTPYINTETPCRLTSQTSVDSSSGPSTDIIDEIVEDGYENPYEFISQERPDKH